ncbi:MAG: ATP-binding cassette domain-containing protein, partial [Actinomycetota bacterium]
MSTPPFELRGGTIELGKVPVLSGIDLTINDGEFLVILGSNGSGKTTLVRALLGL